MSSPSLIPENFVENGVCANSVAVRSEVERSRFGFRPVKGPDGKESKSLVEGDLVGGMAVHVST